MSDSLQGQKATTAKALERIVRRIAKILYENQKWFKWIRQCQDDEEAHREKEQKKVKQEAAMFKRLWKAAEQRLSELRAKEEKRKQDAFLEQVYKERMVEQAEHDDEDNSDWDPIDDVLEDNRGNFIGMCSTSLLVHCFGYGCFQQQSLGRFPLPFGLYSRESEPQPC